MRRTHPLQRRRRAVVTALIGVTCMVGCTRRDATPRDGSRPLSTRGGVQLTRLTPSSAAIGAGQIVRVLAIGRGFDASDNIVEFGPVMLTSVAASPSRDTIAFTVPLTEDARGGAPPRAITSGTYYVRVRTSTGATDSLPFRVNAEFPRQ